MAVKIRDIAYHLPSEVLSNEDLAAIYPDWSADKIFTKTGIKQRHIAQSGVTASDLAFEAAKKLFESGKVLPEQIDFLILCTQAPDYILPTSACILQHRLGLPRSAGALDVNLGCSGFVYGLSLAKGLIESGLASNVLLLTADTYSKYIHPMDKSVRTLFGDAAAATVISKSSGDSDIGPFVFGTDGSGAGNLIVEAGGFRLPRGPLTAQESTDDSGNVRSNENLYMNGAEIMAFTLKEVPEACEALLRKAGLDHESVDLFVLHQANKFMLDALRKKMKIPVDKMPILIGDCGNTVSSTIPIALHRLRSQEKLFPGQQIMLIGFGVGYSWAACFLKT
jgi:3-oxoacyl-[acyl-carrier-protein] synthase-3